MDGRGWHSATVCRRSAVAYVFDMRLRTRTGSALGHASCSAPPPHHVKRDGITRLAVALRCYALAIGAPCAAVGALCCAPCSPWPPNRLATMGPAGPRLGTPSRVWLGSFGRCATLLRGPTPRVIASFWPNRVLNSRRTPFPISLGTPSRNGLSQLNSTSAGFNSAAGPKLAARRPEFATSPRPAGGAAPDRRPRLRGAASAPLARSGP